jgi:hypothetical protein
MHPKPHISSANHHDLTIKTPHQNTHFSQNTPRKQQKNNKKLLATTSIFFSAKTRGLGLENGLEEQTDSHHP